jgi:hypothetical protein
VPDASPDTDSPPSLAEIPNGSAIVVEEHIIIGLFSVYASAQKLKNGTGHLDQPTVVVLCLAAPEPDAFIKKVNLIDP